MIRNMRTWALSLSAAVWIHDTCLRNAWEDCIYPLLLYTSLMRIYTLDALEMNLLRLAKHPELTTRYIACHVQPPALIKGQPSWPKTS